MPTATILITLAPPSAGIGTFVRLFAADGYAVDVEVTQQPLQATYTRVAGAGAPITAIASSSAWWSVNDDGAILAEPFGRGRHRTVYEPDASRGRAVGLATYGNVVVAVLMVAGDSEEPLNVTIVLFDGSSYDELASARAVPGPGVTESPDGGETEGPQQSTLQTTAPTATTPAAHTPAATSDGSSHPGGSRP